MLAGKGLLIEFFLLTLVLLYTGVRPAWAVTITPPLPVVTVTPSTPTARVPFALSGVVPSAVSLTVYRNGVCSGAFFFARGVGPGEYNLTVPGQPAGQYGAMQSGSACVPFTVVPG